MGTLLKVLKNNSPKYLREQINRLIKEGKIKNLEEFAEKIRDGKTIFEVLREYGLNYQERKYGRGTRRCMICGEHARVIRKYGLNICGRCFREYAKILGFEKYGE